MSDHTNGDWRAQAPTALAAVLWALDIHKAERHLKLMEV